MVKLNGWGFRPWMEFEIDPASGRYTKRRLKSCPSWQPGYSGWGQELKVGGLGAVLCSVLVWAGLKWPLQLAGLDQVTEQALQAGQSVQTPFHRMQPFVELAKLVAAVLIGALVTAVHTPVTRDRPRSLR